MENNKKWFLSSENNGELSTTLKGLINAVIPLLVALGQAKGMDISNEIVVSFVASIWGIVAAVQVSYGLGRKILNSIKK